MRINGGEVSKKWSQKLGSRTRAQERDFKLFHYWNVDGIMVCMLV